MSLVLHPTTKKHVSSLITDMPHALIISGPHGIGASTLATWLASHQSKTVITILPEKDEKIDLEKGTITAKLIRNLYDQTRSKGTNRVVIIDYAERMASTAQNAFLKLLEEPVDGITFLLVTHDPTKLLPTVRSRSQRLDMQPVSRDQSIKFVKSLGVDDPTKQTQLLYMAEGLPAELFRLLSDPNYFTAQAQMVRDARELLQGNAYQKLIIAHTYKDRRLDSLRLIDIAIRMVRQSLVVSTSPEPASIARLELLIEAYDRIQANGNIRLQFARLAL